MRIQLPRLLVILLGLLLLPAWDCGGPLTRDPGFDLWCGDQLCAWEVEKGSIRRVPTWHRSDFGAELLGPETVLSQLVHTSVKCFVVELQAQRDAGVELSLELDFLGDGTIDHAQPITSEDWVPAKLKLTAPTWYQDVRFVVRKRGSGRAVLAHIGVTVGSDCQSPPLPLLNRPDGAGCSSDAECANRHCEAADPWWPGLVPGSAKACAGCGRDEDCKAGELCGVGPALAFWKHRACVARASQALGGPCLGDGECATGICCSKACSACCDGRECPGAARCARAELHDLGMSYSSTALPFQCGPGEKLGAPSAGCLRDEDCASLSCQGRSEVGYCAGALFSFGARCTKDGDCPEEQVCEPVAILGGVCR